MKLNWMASLLLSLTSSTSTNRFARRFLINQSLLALPLVTAFSSIGRHSNPTSRRTVVASTATPTFARRRDRKRLTSASFALLVASGIAGSPHSASLGSSPLPPTFATVAHCSSSNLAEEDNIMASAEIETPPFPEDCLEFDHYNGIAIHLEKLDASDYFGSSSAEERRKQFHDDLETALQFWKVEGRKGIWIHVPKAMSYLLPSCMDQGFDFHFVKDSKLILSQWLPTDRASKLPFGPTHQIGVGCIVLHPDDPSKILVVQERTGPAAARKLWKMPTGLLDPGEDVPEAALRELKEETGLDARMDGILCFRQAHRPSSSSDLFFVVQLSLLNPEDAAHLKPQEDEIAEIEWMSVNTFCDQEVWQQSPLYKTLNGSIQIASKAAVERHKLAGLEGESAHGIPSTAASGLIRYDLLDVGFSRPGQNGLYSFHDLASDESS